MVKKYNKNTSVILPENIASKILLIRGKKVMLDRDLAELYGVKAIALRQQVKRNPLRFPEDFLMQLSSDETARLLSQNVIPSKRSLGGFLPYAFTEQGVAMLSSVLNSENAVEVNIQIMRTFTKIREMLSSNQEIIDKINRMERKYDQQFRVVFEAIRHLIEPSKTPGKQIGFKT